jgi:hypothetical protein
VIGNIPQTSEEYRAWWEQNTTVPYGYCWCGCGQQTELALRTTRRAQLFKNEPKRYVEFHHIKARIPNHFPNTPASYGKWWELNARDVPYGYCWCGRGGKMPVAVRTDSGGFALEGEPRRYVPHHGNKLGRRAADGSWLYVGRCDGVQADVTVVKIGISENLEQRFQQLNAVRYQIRCPVSLVSHYDGLKPIVLWWRERVINPYFVEAVVRRSLKEHRLDDTEFFVWGPAQAKIPRNALDLSRERSRPVEDNKKYHLDIQRCARDVLLSLP